MKKVKLLHIMPHLGGGVGKALSTLVAGQLSMPIEHQFLLLERPEKSQFVEIIESLGCVVQVCPDTQAAESLIADADIVQLEWWNHPATFRFLGAAPLPAMRLVIWCHVSGLHTPLIPKALIGLADRFLVTSACSLNAESVSTLTDLERAKLDVVSSGVGLAHVPENSRSAQQPLTFGYMGSLNFSKLHPQLVEYLAAVKDPGFQLSVWGDALNLTQLTEQCQQQGKPDLVHYAGFTTEVAAVLASLDVFVYLLNPLHYGTAENILLEAMSAGVVPVVLANPAELAIVEHGYNGLVVDSIAAFTEAIEWLQAFPEQRIKLGQNAAASIAEHYTREIMAEKMHQHYREVLMTAKHPAAFREALGTEPLAWYQACRPSSENPAELRYAQLNAQELTKGSLQHFRRYFPEHQKLKDLAKSCE